MSGFTLPSDAIFPAFPAALHPFLPLHTNHLYSRLIPACMKKGFFHLGMNSHTLIASRIWFASRLLFRQFHFLFPFFSFPLPTLLGLLAPPSISLTLVIISIPNQFYRHPLLPHPVSVSLPSRHWITRGESLRVLQPLDTGINGSDVTHLSVRYDSRRRWKIRSLENYSAFGVYRPIHLVILMFAIISPLGWQCNVTASSHFSNSMEACSI